MELIAWSILFVALSCLDLVTTYSAMRGMSPDEMRERELNPLMGRIISNKPLAWAVKLLAAGLILLACFRLMKPEVSLRLITFLSIGLALVVVSNLCASWAQRHQRLSVGRFLMERLGFPRVVAFLLITGTILGISYFGASLLY